jgi:hypothetical protein
LGTILLAFLVRFLKANIHCYSTQGLVQKWCRLDASLGV